MFFYQKALGRFLILYAYVNKGCLSI